MKDKLSGEGGHGGKESVVRSQWSGEGRLGSLVLSGPLSTVFGGERVSSAFAIPFGLRGFITAFLSRFGWIFEGLGLCWGIQKAVRRREMKAVMNPRTPKMAKVEVRVRGLLPNGDRSQCGPIVTTSPFAPPHLGGENRQRGVGSADS